MGIWLREYRTFENITLSRHRVGFSKIGTNRGWPFGTAVFWGEHKGVTVLCSSVLCMIREAAAEEAEALHCASVPFRRETELGRHSKVSVVFCLPSTGNGFSIPLWGHWGWILYGCLFLSSHRVGIWARYSQEPQHRREHVASYRASPQRMHTCSLASPVLVGLKWHSGHL